MKQIAIYILGIIALTSCAKYLEEKPDKSLLVPTTIDDFQKILDEAPTMLRINPSFGEASADDYFLTESVVNSLDLIDISKYTWEMKDYTWSNDWSLAYASVYNANLCLEEIEKIPVTNVNMSAWNNVKGSALFFRAINFLNLAWGHSKSYNESTANTDLGIVLRLGSDFNVPSVRSSVKNTYEQIILDAQQAAEYLPDNPVHPYRPSKAAAFGLLSRTYLSMRSYDSAYKYSNLCLGIKGDILDYNDPLQVTLTATFPFKPFNPEMIFYYELNSSNPLFIPFQANIDTVLFLQYDKSDLRKTAFFRANTPYPVFKGSYTSLRDRLFAGIATDEILLTRAECNARAGRVGDALTDLNVLLQKRWKKADFVPVTAIDKDDALRKILKERRKELLMRGLRWMDIKRLNLENMNIVLKRRIGQKEHILAPNSNYYALPLPKDIIEQSGIPQNPR